jgi:L-fuculose-phosphate aldolase
MTIKYEETRKAVVEAGVKILHSHLVVGTWGNISARVKGEDLVAITPSGVDYDTITPEDIVVMDFAGNVVDGEKKPSIEYNMHIEVYKQRHDVNAVVHTHSEYCTAMAIARKPIPPAAEDLVQIVGGEVRVSEYKFPGSKELGYAVVKALEGRNAVLLANHGCLGVARDLTEALKVVMVVEKSAKATIFAHIMGGVVNLEQADIDEMREFYLNKYGQR